MECCNKNIGLYFKKFGFNLWGALNWTLFEKFSST